MSDRPEMPSNEAIQMMQRCSREIKDLRAQIAFLQPKADAYDNLAAVLRLLPRSSMGMSEDLAWTLDRRIEAMTKAEQPDPADPVDGPA